MQKLDKNGTLTSSWRKHPTLSSISPLKYVGYRIHPRKAFNLKSLKHLTGVPRWKSRKAVALRVFQWYITHPYIFNNLCRGSPDNVSCQISTLLKLVCLFFSCYDSQGSARDKLLLTTFNVYTPRDVCRHFSLFLIQVFNKGYVFIPQRI